MIHIFWIIFMKILYFECKKDINEIDEKNEFVAVSF